MLYQDRDLYNHPWFSNKYKLKLGEANIKINYFVNIGR